MRKTIFLILILATSCFTKKEYINNEELLKILNTNIIKYFETKNSDYLQLAYKKMNHNSDYKNYGLTSMNSKLVISLLLNMKKFDELEMLLEKDSILDSYNKNFTLNIVKFLKKSKTNKKRADIYIKNNIDLIKDSFRKNPQDSLLLADYFSMKMFLIGKENALKEIDSMQNVNRKYSKLFYQEILKESIINFPDELVPLGSSSSSN